jgi:hypothetical protein
MERSSSSEIQQHFSVRHSRIKELQILAPDQDQQHAKTTIRGSPLNIIPNAGPSKKRRIFSSAVSLPEPGRVKSWPYLGYMLNAYKNLFLTFYFNWPMIFTSPISSAAFLTVYPTTVMFLLAFEFGLKLFMEKWGGAKLIKFISLKYGHGKMPLVFDFLQKREILIIIIFIFFVNRFWCN